MTGLCLVSMDAVYENSYTNDAYVGEDEEKDPPPPGELTPTANRRGLSR